MFSICILREFVQTALLLLALGSLYVPVGTFLPQKRVDLCQQGSLNGWP